MNLQNMQILHDWLMAGAPHVARFDMHNGLDVRRAVTEPGCGTVCCIAGAAQLFAVNDDGTMPSRSDQITLASQSPWYRTRGAALIWLDLPKTEYDSQGDDYYMGHPLFDLSLAPENCTPEQAADAVKRVMNGELPWPDAQLPNPEDA